MAFIVPPDVKDLSMVRAFCFYRDVLAWHDHPVHPPWADPSKVNDPGKQPVFKQWWAFDPHDCNLRKWFDNERPYNIGVAPTNGLVIVDLDSKPDKGASVDMLLIERPDLLNTPMHITRNGVHLVYICPDLPKWTHPDGRSYHEKLIFKLNPSVTAELFYSDHSNVVLPPSRHPSDDFVYEWSVFGEIKEVSWQWLQDTYGFKEPGLTKPKRKKPGRWYEAYQGDLSSLNLIALLETLGHPGRLLGEEEGKYAIICPWETEHTTKKDSSDYFSVPVAAARISISTMRCC
jgi:hypothetical protein